MLSRNFRCFFCFCHLETVDSWFQHRVWTRFDRLQMATVRLMICWVIVAAALYWMCEALMTSRIAIFNPVCLDFLAFKRVSTLLRTPSQAWTDCFLILCLNVLLGGKRFEPAAKKVGMSSKCSILYIFFKYQYMYAYHVISIQDWEYLSYSHSWYWRKSRVVEVQWSFHERHKTC